MDRAKDPFLVDSSSYPIMSWLAASRLRSGRFGVGIGLHPGGRSSSSSPSPPGRAGVASRGVSLAGGRVSALPRTGGGFATGRFERSILNECRSFDAPAAAAAAVLPAIHAIHSQEKQKGL